VKTLWNVLACTAILNVLAILGVGGWLWKSDRIDAERARRVREMFLHTVAAEKTERESELRRSQDEAAAADAAKKAARAPLTASEQLAARIEVSELDRQRVAALQAQVDALQKALSDAQKLLANERLQVERERLELAKARQDAESSIGEEQFQKTLNVLTSLKPAEARIMLGEILYGVLPPSSVNPPGFREVAGDTVAANTPAAVDDVPAAMVPGDPNVRPTPGKRQVLAYLDAMDERPRTKIIAEFMKSNPRLAAELLESLRSRGQIAHEPGKTPA